MNTNLDTPDANSERRHSWRAALAGALPFLMFGSAYALEGMHELGHFADLPGIFFHYLIVLVYLLVASGFGIGWALCFPRWSYAYLGMALYFSMYFSQGRYYGVVYGWRAWIPILVAALVGLVISCSLRPPASLITGMWADWTRLSFGLYAFSIPVFTTIFMDGDWGWFELAGLFFDTLMLAAGAAGFILCGKIWQRALALQSAVFILVLRGMLFGGWYPSFSEHLRSFYPPALLYLLLWCAYLLLPGLVGLFRRGVVALSPR